MDCPGLVWNLCPPTVDDLFFRKNIENSFIKSQKIISMYISAPKKGLFNLAIRISADNQALSKLNKFWSYDMSISQTKNPRNLNLSQDILLLASLIKSRQNTSNSIRICRLDLRKLLTFARTVLSTLRKMSCSRDGTPDLRRRRRS